MRSKLFVPGSRPELFEKALASEADAISFDLEDAVAYESKGSARSAVQAFIQQRSDARSKLLIVRTNALHSEFFTDDLAAVVRAGLDVVNVPKVEGPEDIVEIASRLGAIERDHALATPLGILATIETPRGVRLAASIAAADCRVVGLQIGFGDLFEPLGIQRSEAGAANAIRLAVRLAAAEAGRPAYDGAFVGVDDPEAFRRECEAARRYGLAGKSCIHPSQIEAVNDVFRPNAAEIAWAERIVGVAEAMLAKGVGAFMVDGVMVDGPFIDRARAVLTLAGEADRHA